MSAAKRLPDLSGQLIQDGAFHLRLLSLLGAGTFGRVYKAVDVTSKPGAQVFYAVKCMARALPGSEDSSMQEREIQCHKAVSDHPNVVTLHRHFTTDEYLFLVLELVEGGTLLDALKRKVFGSDTERIKCAMEEVIDAVEHLQANGVAHRDIKPDNFLCDKDGSNIRLADFGLATIGWTSNHVAGTRPYLAPEAFESNASLRLNDLWATAMTFANIISSSGCPLWKEAKVADPDFQCFLGNPGGFLEAALGMRLTHECLLYLDWCFHPDPEERPTLFEMRSGLDDIPAFEDATKRRDSVSTVASGLTTGESALESSVVATSEQLEHIAFVIIPASQKPRRRSVFRRFFKFATRKL
ncbi:Protein kinase domain-containing protein [Mycena kentingensis (nom. inval.)]|nr:Protein kinase domain-containing protein [Mycena kentingensis (nom. inval.)]